MIKAVLTSKWTKVVVFALCLVPLAILIWRGFHNELGANHIEFITHATGDWTLRFLILTLAITPLRKILHQPLLIRFRRMLGLFAFFYVCLHFATWIGLDKFFDWSEMWKDVQKRRFITVGFAGFILLIPLALRGVQFRPMPAMKLLQRNLMIYGVGGIIAPFLGIKLIDIVITSLHLI